MDGVAVRRARPALGTLVELGLRSPPGLDTAAAAAWAAPALAAAWREVAEVERAMSAFDPASDVGRFNQAPAGAVLTVGPSTAIVLRAAAFLQRESGGIFDVSLGSGPGAWAVEAAPRGTHLVKRAADVRLDLGGIAKGFAVDRAFAALAAHAGPGRGCWVNAGGDLRAQGVPLPIRLRDERTGGVRPWLTLWEGAIATSDLSPGARSQLAGAIPAACSVTVLAPTCLHADALTKVVAATGDAEHQLLEALSACAWVHSREA